MSQSLERLFTILLEKEKEIQAWLTILGNSVLSWYSLIASESSTITPITGRVISG